MTAIFEENTTVVRPFSARSFSAVVRISLLALACLITAKTHDEWNILTVKLDKTVTIWVESSSIQRSDDYVFARVTYDRENAAEDGAMSFKALNQYDCANRQASDSLEIRRDDDCAQAWKPVFYRTTEADILTALAWGGFRTATVPPRWLLP